MNNQTNELTNVQWDYKSESIKKKKLKVVYLCCENPRLNMLKKKREMKKKSIVNAK